MVSSTLIIYHILSILCKGFR